MLQPTDYIWMNGELVPWSEAKVHALTHTLHYGGGCFEGIRAYKTEKGTAIFRLKEHMHRLHYSASALAMNVPYSVQQLCDATVELVKANNFEHGYIRPLVYFGYGVMGLRPQESPVDLLIACWPWGKYLGEEMVDVKVSKYIRIHPDSTIADAKICGHYVNSMLATLDLRGTHYHEALFLDATGRVAEGPSENFFMVKDGKLITPKVGTILIGITRATVMELAKAFSIPVVEQDITVDEILSADEAFFTGTAAEVTPIKSLNDKLIGKGTTGPVTEKLRTAYTKVVHGEDPAYQHFLTYTA